MTNCVDLVSNFLKELWNNKALEDKSELYNIFSPALIINSPLGKRIGPKNLVTINDEWILAFPDLQVSNIQIERYNNTVISSWKSSATHKGMFKKITPSEKKICYPGETIFIFKEGKIIRYSCKIDLLIIYNQLGLRLTPEEYDKQTILFQDKRCLIKRIKECLSERLTTREVEMLSFYIIGFNAKQIGRICSISHRTVETHLFRALHELDCTNKFQCLEKIIASFMLPLMQDLAKLLLKNHEKTKKSLFIG